MSLKIFCLVLLLTIPGAAWPGEAPSPSNPAFLEKLPEELRRQEPLRTDLIALFAGYRGYCERLELQGNRRLSIIMKGGGKFLYDDGRPKTFADRLEQPDLEDSLAQDYPAGKPSKEFKPDYDPGRFRVNALFNSVYGETPAEVKANMVPVGFCGRTIQFNSHNGAAAALAKVGQKLDKLLSRKPELRSYVFPLGGVYTRRNIAGTQRLSPHSWGIALDLNPQYGAYWLWKKNQPGCDIISLRLAYPLEIVTIFEEEGFIWGGKWSHYDLMHFEYRPELLIKSRLVVSQHMH